MNSLIFLCPLIYVICLLKKPTTSMISVNLIAVLQTFLFAIFLMSNNDNVLNKLLGLLLLIIGINLLGNTFVIFDILPHYLNGYYFITQGVGLLVAPLIFYYLRRFSGKKTKRIHPLFVVSFFVFIYILYLGFNYYLLPYESQKIYFEALLSDAYPKELKLFTWILVLLQHVYFTISLIEVFSFKKIITDVFSTRSRTRNDFAYKFILLVWILDTVLILSYACLEMYQTQFIVYPAKIILAFSLILYYVLKQNVLFNSLTYEPYLLDVALLNKAYDDVKEEKNSVFIGVEMINEALVTQKLFLNPTLTIFDLAKALDCSHRIVSASINKGFNKTFSILVNDLRVEEAKRLLEDNPKNLTMEGVGLESGFNSRASFYRVFKNKLKITPLEFMKKNTSIL